MTEFRLPHEVLDGARVPDEMRAHVAYRVLAAKFCALVEAVIKKTGEPIEISLDRAQEILDQDPLTSDVRSVVMVAERKLNDAPGPIVLIDLATVEEIRAANRRYALSRMGARRN